MKARNILILIGFAFFTGICGNISKSSASQSEQLDSKVRLDLSGAPEWVMATDIWTNPAKLKIQFLTASKKLVPIAEFDQEGNAIPQMVSVFKANLKSASYLITIIAWPYSLPGVDTEGTVFEIHAFKITQHAEELIFTEDAKISDLFGSGFDGKQEGDVVKFGFKNASQIRTELKRLKLLR